MPRVHRARMMMLMFAPLLLLACESAEDPAPAEEQPAAAAPAPEPAPVEPATLADAPPAEAPEPVASVPAPERELIPRPSPVTYVPPPISTGVFMKGNADPDLKLVADELDPETGFAANAFPPTLSDTKHHRDAWLVNDCMRCHETGVMGGPVVKHRGMPAVLVDAKCRSCHVLIPGDGEDAIIIEQVDEEAAQFEDYAFPPMIPNSTAHLDAWTIDSCLRCHEDGTNDAPIVQHKSDHLPRRLLKVSCRTCHVQVRAIEADSPLEEEPETAP